VKKTLFILLAVMALFALLIVPASAEEAHTGHCVCGGTYDGCDHTEIEGEWIAWDGTTNITASGNYYLTAPLTTQRWLGAYDYAGEERLVINLCLNGISCDSAYRVFGVGKNTTVNLMNCSENVAVLKGDCSTNDNGKVIRIHTSSSILNMYGNIRLEGKATTGRVTIAGGTIISEGTFNMYGGELVGAYVGGDNTASTTGVHNGNGGVIYLGSAGTWNLYDGNVIGGSGGQSGSNTKSPVATRSLGGVAYLTNGAKWNMYGGTVTGGIVGDGAVAYVTGANARMNVYGGTIHAGNAAFGGGVAKVQAGSIVTVSGGYIDGVNTLGKNQNAGGAGGGAFMVDGSHLVVNGTAEIVDCTTTNYGGAIKVINANSTVTLGGSAKIHSNGTSNGAASNNASGKNRNDNIYLGDGMKPIIVENTITSDAYFGISMATPGVFTGAITAEQAAAFCGDNGVITQLEDGTLSLSADGHVAHCICGGASEFCDEHANVEWKAYTGGNITESGNYYLTNDAWGSQIQIGQNGAEPITVNICLNGNDFVNPGFRAFINWNNSTLTFCNCKGESGGRVMAGGPAEGASDHTGLMMLNGTVNIYEGVTFMRTSERLVTGSGGFSIYGGATLNLYGGTIIGGRGKQGGTLTMYAGSTFNMYGGLVTGGTSVGAHGGNLYVDNANVNIYGGVISNGTALAADGATGDALDKNGGNIAIFEGSVVNISGDAQIIGGTGNRGGNIFVHRGHLNISDNAKVLGGTATQVMYGPGGNGIHINFHNHNYSNATEGAVISLAGTPEIDDLFLSNGAFIVNKGIEEGIKINSLVANTQNNMTDGYISEEIAAGITYNDSYVNKGYKMYVTRDGLLASGETDPHIHCMCGSTNGVHTDGCDGLPIYFWAWNGVGNKTSGNYGYYLTQDVSTYQAWMGATYQGNYDSKDSDTNPDIWGVDRDGDGVYESGYEVTVCMNGHNRSSNGRCWGLGNGSILNIVNCSSEGGQNIAAGAANAQAGNIFCHGANHVVRLFGNVSFSKTGENAITEAGLIYMPTGGKLIIDGATITGTTTKGVGGAIYTNGTEITIYDATITGGTASAGGAIYANNKSTVTIYDGTISGGTAGWGGNIGLTGNSTLKMYGGTIENGTATGKNDHGGNLYVHNDSQAEILGGIIRGGKTTGTGDSNGGNIAMSDTNNNGDLVTLTIGGNAQILDGKAYRGANVFFHSGILTIKDNAIINAGTVNEEGSNPDTNVVGYMNPGVVLNNTVGNATNPEGILILEGTPDIADLYLNGPVMDVSGLQAGAKVGLDCNFAGKVSDTPISDEVAVGFTYVGSENLALYNSEYALLLITPGNEVTLDGKTMPIEAAVLVAAENGSYITLDKDLNGDIGIFATVTIDLNGHDIIGDIKVDEACELSVFDSTNTSLTEAAEGRGKIIGRIVGGPLNRVMNTPASFGHNYKYIYVNEIDGSKTFHRVYMSVKSVVFTPYDTGVNFKTVLKCNDVVANYIAIGGYGVRINGYNYSYNATPVSGADNQKIVKVKNVLGTADMLNLEKAQADAETMVNAQVMLKLTDGATVYSAENGKTLLELVTIANEQFAELTDRQQAALGAMYQTFEALMSTWDDATVGNIRGYQNADPEEGAVFHCYCYGTDAADVATACAAAGHPEVKWLPWNRTNTVPSYGGNYYLTNDVTVYGTSYPQTDALVAIDLNGHTITSEAWNNFEDTTDETNIFYLKNNNSSLIITDSVGGGKIIPSEDTNWQTGLGMAVRVGNANSTFYLYAGTIDATDVVADYGVAVWNNGTVNMYGGAVTGGISGEGSGSIFYSNGTVNMYGGVIANGQQLDPLTEQRYTRGGGNVRIGGGTFNMYGGSIENGYAVGNGGNIRIGGSSVFNMYGGSIKGGVSDNYGGNIYVADTAQFNISGGSVEGGQALRGGNFLLVNSSKLNMTAGTVKGGYVTQTGGSIRAEGTSQVTISGGKVIGMTAEELAAIPVGEEEAPKTAAAVNGGLFFLENSSVLTVSGKSTLTGGIASSYGGTVFMNADSKMTIDGATVNGGTARYGGAFAMDARSTLNLVSGTVNGGSATDPENTASKGGTLYMIATDVVKDGVVTTNNATTFNMTGGTIYGGKSYNGAVIYAREDSTINMSAGTIYAGEAVRGGGAAKIEAGAVFNMSGTAVIDGANPYQEEGTVHCGNNGGGMFVDSAVFNMSGDAIIQNCVAGKKGGGIMVNNDAKAALGAQVTLSGNAQVINNASASTVTSAGAGIVLNNSKCALNVSGNVQVTGNYDAYGMSSDVSTLTDAVVTVAGNLGSNALIGIYNSAPVFANGAYATADNAAYFYSNIDAEAVATAANNQLSFAASFLVGYAVAEINPTSDGTVYGDLMEGIKLTGYGNQDERIATSVDEELGLQASVLIITGLDGETICVVSYDAGGNGAQFYKTAAQKISEKTGIPTDHIMFNANHQHSTPVSHSQYNALFAENVSNAAVDAMAARAKTAMYGGSVHVNAGLPYSQHFNYVRNYTLRNTSGSIVGMVTDNHSDVGRVTYNKMVAESLADDEVQLVKFVREGASTIIMANFQTHPHLLTDSNSTVVTSDIVGVFRNELKASLEAADGTGTEYEVMYINGAGGNINASGNGASYSTDSSDTTKAWARTSDYATRLAHAKLLPQRTYAGMSAANFWTSLSAGEVSTANTVASYQKMLNAPLSWTGKTTAQLVAAAKEVQENGYTTAYRDTYGIYSKFHANSIVTRENNKVGDMYDIYLGAFAIGDLAFVSAPYEMFDTNGMEIKNGSPFAMTFINSLSTLGSNTSYSGHIGYIPSALGYANGGYSADISYVAAGTGENLVADFLEMLEGLK